MTTAKAVEVKVVLSLIIPIVRRVGTTNPSSPSICFQATVRRMKDVKNGATTGTKKKFFHIISKYDMKQSTEKTGVAIDFFNASFQEEGNSAVEFLINQKFVVDTFKEKCNLELVESENFQNIYNTFRQFFSTTAKYEEELRTREFFKKVEAFYDLTDEVNKASFELSRLNKLYVFQKRDPKFMAKVKRTK